MIIIINFYLLMTMTFVVDATSLFDCLDAFLIRDATEP